MKYTHFIVGSALLLTTISGCGKPADRVEITQITTRSPHRPDVRIGATSAERFQLALGQASNATTGPTTDAAPFHWSVPATWQELAPTQFRIGNFRVGSKQDTECYLSILGGGGGGLLANVNRWRGQMGLAGYTTEEFDNLDRRRVLGREAVLVNFEGAYKGMGDVAKEGYRLVGVLFDLDGKGVYVKMVGPSETVQAELDNFSSFLSSIHTPQGHSHDQPDPPPAPSAGNLPEGHPPISAGSTPNIQSSSAPSGFTWDVPSGWTESNNASAMRLVTLNAGPASEAECYIVVLGGAGGGIANNLNRWLGQVGQSALSESEIAALPTLTVLGQAVPYLAAEGQYTGMGDRAEEGSMLLGVAVLLDGRSLFIKMTGPAALVKQEQERFKAFCTSLKRN